VIVDHEPNSVVDGLGRDRLAGYETARVHHDDDSGIC
jgi:hypothetical protein